MTEKKKRGLLSWLGFGDEEQTKDVQGTDSQNPEQNEEITDASENVVSPDQDNASEAILEETQPAEESAVENSEEVDEPVLAEAEAE
ncbi:signal recognition particle-docking protein FtsY, partial [Vibrio amylolyticus]